MILSPVFDTSSGPVGLKRKINLILQNIRTESQLVVFQFKTLAYKSDENCIKKIFTMTCQLELLNLGLYISSSEHLLCT